MLGLWTNNPVGEIDLFGLFGPYDSKQNQAWGSESQKKLIV
jgi:hypothetical protein